MNRIEIQDLLLRTRGLALFRGVLDSPAARSFVELLELLKEERSRPVEISSTFGVLWEELALDSGYLLSDAWRSHLVERILDDENPFSRGTEFGSVRWAVREQARKDLQTLRSLFDLDAKAVFAMLEDAVPGLTGMWVPWTDPEPDADSARHTIARKLAAVEDWEGAPELLAVHYERHGAGAFGRNRAFRWRAGELHTVAHPDSIELDDLIDYGGERDPLIKNTERFLAGLPAQHALLYGLPGTGKSSTVKALLHEYAGQGLRIVEVAKEDLGELPRVLDLLRGRGPRFILFVDDLSFEEHEIEYKALKALLEGSVEEPPENVRLYATSNRRNLIRESFDDRDEDDVHARDTMQEKLSLSARFGLRVTFPAPDQGRYLRIVSGLAQRRGVKLTEEALRERALLWDRWHAGRSGRTARQFVDELQAELTEDRDVRR